MRKPNIGDRIRVIEFGETITGLVISPTDSKGWRGVNSTRTGLMIPDVVMTHQRYRDTGRHAFEYTQIVEILPPKIELDEELFKV